MTPKLDPLFDELGGSWRFRWVGLLVAVAVAILGWLVIFALPDRYEAQAQVLVDTRTALKPVLEGLATNVDVNVQLNYVRQALLADPQLTQFAERAGVMPATGLGPARQQKLLDRLRKRIDLSVEPTPDQANGSNIGSTTYGITYQDVDRARALRLVQMMTQSLINETLGGSQQGSAHAQQFLQTQIADYEKRLQAAEDRLAAFKSQHFGVLPTEQGGYFAQLQRENEAAEEVKLKMLVAESQRSELQNQLHGDAAVSATDATGVMGPNGLVVGGDTLSQIQQAQTHLNQLLLKYTDKYPDVIAARQQLAALKQRRVQEIAALKRGDANAAAMSGASANPVYQSIQLALNKANVSIADLHTELAEHQQKAQELQQLLDKTPQLEAQYAHLSRDYDINRKQYAALLGSYDKARLGEQAGDAGAVRFELVQPPTVSYVPVWPKRISLLTIVLLLALGAGGAFAYGGNQLHPVVGSPTGLKKWTGIPVVAVVGCAFPTRTARTTRAQIWRFSFALVCLIVGFVVVVVMSHLGYRLIAWGGSPTVSA